jgi:tetratricopeptide (TPR) repeat protein
MGTLISIGTLLFLVAIIWFLSKKFGSPRSKAGVLLLAYQACKESGAPEDECLFQMFDTRPPWNSLPKTFLREIATRLRTKENIVNFIIFSERTGILQTNILRTPSTVEFDPDFALGGVARALISRANAFSNRSKFRDAKDVLEWVVLLSPRFVHAWSSMAVVAFRTNDYQTALYWAEKVLNYLPNPNSDDSWERGYAEFMSFGGSEKAAQLLGEPGGTDTWKQVQQQMETIRDACSR